MKKMILALIFLYTCMLITKSIFAADVSAVVFREKEYHIAQVQDNTITDSSAMVLPASLTIIETEAFAGTAFSYIQLPETLTSIQNRAFADMPVLTHIIIPSSVSSIAVDAFNNSSYVVLIGTEGSYAEQWAHENGYCFIPDISRSVSSQFDNGLTNKNSKQFLAVFLLFVFCQLFLTIHKRKTNYRRVYEGRSMRPQERAEIHPIPYQFP